MNRLDQRLNTLKANGEKALVTFITAGDPNLALTEQYVLAMVEAGADLIELGIPFSDPVAEGPIIQRASARALSNEINLDKIFETVLNLRTQTQIPLAFMMYINSLYSYGKEQFFERCKETGVDAVIIPDLPFEERAEVLEEAKAFGVHLIYLVAPSSQERIGRIASQSSGFLYCVTSLGVTGERQCFETDFQTFMKQVRAHTEIPAYLGFGISTVEQVRSLKGYGDGIIVGSSLIRRIEDHPEEAEEKIREWVKILKQTLRE